MNKLTTESFIKKCNEKFNNKYNYSLVKYVNNSTKVDIICPVHGIFQQTPAGHLTNQGCRQCSIIKAAIKRTSTTEDFIKKAVEKYGNKHDYSLVNYITDKIKIKIICKIHGVFEKNPNNYLTTGNCSECSKTKMSIKFSFTTEKFIEKASKIHNNKYDYSLVNYKNNTLKLKIICPIHGEFEQTGMIHIKGAGCSLCSSTKNGIKSRINTKDFIKKANIIHNFKYDYSKVNYITAITPIIIRCPIHNFTFKKTPNDHLCGRACNKCSNKHRHSTQEFIEKMKIVHNNKYIYDENVIYINMKSKINVFCPVHNNYFKVSCANHSKSRGCPECSSQYNNYKKSNWIKRANNKQGTFYIIKCWNGEEEFLKLGITYNSVKNRYNHKKAMPYNYKIVKEIKSNDLNYIWDLEKRFIRKKLKQHYTPLIKFGGSTYECFKN